MDEIVKATRQAFPDGLYRSPASETEIRAAEQDLGVRIPGELKSLYLAFDGFQGPGDAWYLYPLRSPGEGHLGLVDWTKFLWTEDWAPKTLRAYLFYGCGTSDRSWGLNPMSPQDIVEYHHSMSAEQQSTGNGIVAIWRADQVEYDQVSAGPAPEPERSRCGMCAVSLDAHEQRPLPYCSACTSGMSEYLQFLQALPAYAAISGASKCLNCTAVVPDVHYSPPWQSTWSPRKSESKWVQGGPIRYCPSCIELQVTHCSTKDIGRTAN